MAPAKTFAVVEIGGHQFKICEDDLIYSEKLDVPVGDNPTLGSYAHPIGSDFPDPSHDMAGHLG